MILNREQKELLTTMLEAKLKYTRQSYNMFSTLEQVIEDTAGEILVLENKLDELKAELSTRLREEVQIQEILDVIK